MAKIPRPKQVKWLRSPKKKKQPPPRKEHRPEWQAEALRFGWSQAEINLLAETLRLRVAGGTTEEVVDVAFGRVTMRTSYTVVISGTGRDGVVYPREIKLSGLWGRKRNIVPLTCIAQPEHAQSEGPQQGWCPAHGHELQPGCTLCGIPPVIEREICECTHWMRYGVHDKFCSLVGGPGPPRRRLKVKEAVQERPSPAVLVIVPKAQQLALL